MNIKNMEFHYRKSKIILLLALLVSGQMLWSQTQKFDFRDLSAFKNPGKSWDVVGNAYADLQESNEIETTRGTGILVNDPDGKAGQDLFTKKQYGDIDLELDYFMAKGSNSGIYFQGQYEIQLKDSWGVEAVTSADNGGVYQRWDPEKPEGEQGYQGYAPRQNVSRAPGLWQHLEVSFQAPRFDKEGKKIKNAKFLYVKLNGVTIHEDLELLGPTRGSMEPGEKALGPLRFQGDHGAVAFRNMEITSFDKPRPELSNLSYKIYEGKFDQESDYANLPPEAEGESVELTADLDTEAEQFLVLYTGELKVEQGGEYTFDLSTSGGAGLIRINGKEVVPLSEGSGKATVDLPSGTHSFELLYSKVQDWVEPGLGLAVSGEGIREYLITEEAGEVEDPVDPILVEANSSKVFRSFMNIPGDDDSRNYLLTHAVSVGHPWQLHYTYDLNRGAIVQLWKGGFIDATPMWYSRGNGSSIPTGSILHLGKPALAVAKLPAPSHTWAADTTGMDFRTLGYQLDQRDLPTFMYSIYGAKILDKSRVLEKARGLQRTISTDTPVDNLYVRVVSGEKVEKLSDELYLVGDKDYYIRLDDTGEAKPLIRKNGEGQEFLVPLDKEITYTLIF